MRQMSSDREARDISESEDREEEERGENFFAIFLWKGAREVNRREKKAAEI